MEESYNFPVFATQGGGLVREISTNPYRYEFVEKPDCSGLNVGDRMPEEWGIMPANFAAQKLIDEEESENLDE